jgi:hypothetical protein
MMQHCVGSELYIRALEWGVADFYSLRDVRGQPHVTLEACDRKIQHCSGHGNRIPEEFLEAIDALRNAMGWNQPAIERMRRPRRRTLPALRGLLPRRGANHCRQTTNSPPARISSGCHAC